MVETSKPFGIIGAMESEVDLLLATMEDKRTHVIAGREFTEGMLGPVPCVVVRCGVGMVNAACCTQALIDRFDVSCVVNTGAAGAVRPGIAVGDLVVAEDAVNWAMDACNFGYAPGQTPGSESASIPLDASLRASAWAAAEAAAKAAGVTAHTGRVASADSFVHDFGVKAMIATTFGAACCEMEGAAIAQVCHANDVPCAIVRAISDTADGEDALDYPRFEEQAARRCAALVRAMALVHHAGLD